MTKKIVMLTLRLTFDDLPAEARAELADGINFRADEDREIAPDLEAVPRMSGYTNDDLDYIVNEAFGEFGIFSDYESQQELWAGTDFYGFVTESEVLSVSFEKK